MTPAALPRTTNSSTQPMHRHYLKLWRLARQFLNPIALFFLKLRCRFGADIAVAGNQRCTVVVASFLRPKNIQTIISSLVKCRFVSDIVVSNHNPDIVMADFIESDDERITILNSARHEPCGYRFKVAGDLHGEYFMILDDDIFMFPEQIRKLFIHLLDDPAVPHGFHGTRYGSAGHDDGNDEIQHVARREAYVDVLHQGYAVTRSQIAHMLQIAEAANRSGQFPDENPVDFADDLMISMSGKAQPRVHNLAPIITCPTSLQEDVAACGRPEFNTRRSRVYFYLRDNVGVSRPSVI